MQATRPAPIRTVVCVEDKNLPCLATSLLPPDCNAGLPPMAFALDGSDVVLLRGTWDTWEELDRVPAVLDWLEDQVEALVSEYPEFNWTMGYADQSDSYYGVLPEVADTVWPLLLPGTTWLQLYPGYVIVMMGDWALGGLSCGVVKTEAAESALG